MWSYYGAKTNIVHYYPPPKYGKIIEPFAGTARYALKYFDREVLLVDKYEVIVQVIVCENTQATWMDFKPMVHQNVLSGKNSEAIWTNQLSPWNSNKQLQLL